MSKKNLQIAKILRPDYDIKTMSGRMRDDEIYCVFLLLILQETVIGQKHEDKP